METIQQWKQYNNGNNTTMKTIRQWKQLNRQQRRTVANSNANFLNLTQLRWSDTKKLKTSIPDNIFSFI